jgi:hypothetical protein
MHDDVNKKEDPVRKKFSLSSNTVYCLLVVTCCLLFIVYCTMNRLLSCHLLWLLVSLSTSANSCYAAFLGNNGRHFGGLVVTNSHDRLTSKFTQQQSQKQTQKQTQLGSTVDARRMGELTEPEQKVFDVMDTIHDSGYLFRIIVGAGQGGGAILETVSALGPLLKVTQSPSTGTNMLTLANTDQTFEFHLQLAQVSKMVLLEKITPAKTLRLIRILNGAGDSVSSLILADESEAAVTWYEGLIAKYGTEIQL